MSSDLIFGPLGQEWHYSKSMKMYDLCNGAIEKITFATTEGPPETYVTITPEATVLVIVDMQNFFLDSKCVDHQNGLKAVGPTIKTIERCRELGIQIIWLNWGLTDDDMSKMPAAVQRGFLHDAIQQTGRHRYTGLGSDMGDGMGRCLFAGSWNADIYPPLKACVEPKDLHCAKNRMSGLWNPDQPLWTTLKAREKSTLLFTGVNTDQCVLGTFVDGYNAGWNCILIDDCCGTTTSGGKEVTFYNIATSYGFITDSAKIVHCKVG